MEARNELIAYKQLGWNAEDVSRGWRRVDAHAIEREPHHCVGGVVRQQGKLFLALGQLRLRVLASGYIANHADITGHLPNRRTDRPEDHIGPGCRAILAKPADLVVGTLGED